MAMLNNQSVYVSWFVSLEDRRSQKVNQSSVRIPFEHFVSELVVEILLAAVDLTVKRITGWW